MNAVQLFGVDNLVCIVTGGASGNGLPVVRLWRKAMHGWY